MLSTIVDFFITSAHADTAAPAAQQGGITSLIPMFLIFFVFLYFVVWRPQSKRAKEQQTLMSSLNKGDEVMTAGGILGKITKLSDQYIGLNVANNVEMVVQKSSIVTILPKGTLKAME